MNGVKDHNFSHLMRSLLNDSMFNLTLNKPIFGIILYHLRFLIHDDAAPDRPLCPWRPINARSNSSDLSCYV